MAESEIGNNVCAQCGKARRETKSGTITGWIFDSSSCRCDAMNTQIEKQTATTPIVCLNCKLPIAHKRKASITQWIFPSGKCACERPVTKFDPSEVHITRAFSSGGTRGSTSGDRHASENHSYASRASSSSASPSSLSSSNDDPKLREIAGVLPDRFDAFEFLGRGAVSSVYGAKDKYLGRVVAVKVFDQGGMDSAELIRFQGEAKIISRLDHPNIVQVFDFGITDAGKPFMVLEYVKGDTLRSLLKSNGPLGREDALNVFSGVASALAYAHGNGFSHRDLKPENLIIQTDPRAGMTAKIIDFGLAKYVYAKDAFTTHSGITLIGTPPYMSPDQASGKAFDVRSEIYSFGCVLFESITGRPPFFADTPLEMLSKHCNETPPDVGELNPGVDDDLIVVVETCLNKNPDDRQQSFEEIVKILDGIASGSTTELQIAEPGRAHFPLKTVVAISLLAIGSIVILANVDLCKPSLKDSYDVVVKDKLRAGVAEKKPKSAVSNTVTVQPVRFDAEANAVELQGEVTPEDYKKVLSYPEARRLNARYLTSLSVEGFETITQIPYQVVNLGGSNADDKIVEKLSGMNSIRKLVLSRTAITDQSMASIAKLKYLEELILDGCGITDHGLIALSKSSSIERLSLKNIGQLSEKGISALRSLPLTNINFDGNHLTAEDMKAASKLKAVQFSFKDAGLDDLAVGSFNCQRARTVEFTNNKIGPEGLREILKSRSLVEVWLSPHPGLFPSMVQSIRRSAKMGDCRVEFRSK